MQSAFIAGILFIIGYYLIIAGIIPFTLKLFFNVPREWVRKLHHLAHTMSIFLYVNIFPTWQSAMLAIFILIVIFYIGLMLIEKFPIHKRMFVQRSDGDFRRQLIAAKLSIAVLIFIFWGLLGREWLYIAVVGAMVWGFGDAAAALAGKRYGQHKVRHPWIEGTKTLEGTLWMAIIAGIAMYFTLLILGERTWYESLIVTLIVAPISAIVELFSRKGSDTITVPLSAALLTLAMMILFLLLG